MLLKNHAWGYKKGKRKYRQSAMPQQCMKQRCRKRLAGEKEMIKRLFNKVSYVQIMVNTASSIAMIVDNIVIGKYLGVEAIAAYGLVAPLLLLIMAVTQVLSTGGQVKCSEELGRQDTDKANGIFALTCMIALVFSILSVAVCFIFQSGITHVLGAKSGTDLYRDTVQYLLGFIIGAPGFVGMLILIPFIQLDGDKKCVINATIVMTVVDCIGDLLAATVFHAGMFGIGIASSLSYYCAFIILILHFLRKKGILRPGFKHIEFNRSAGIFLAGTPAALQKVLRTLLSLTINHTLIILCGPVALGIFTVVNSVLNLCNSAGQGMGASTLLLSGLFYAEEDKVNLKEVVRSFLKNSIVINLVMTVIVALAAEPLVLLFTRSGEVDVHQAVLALRIGIIDFVFFSLANCFKNYYQGTNHRMLTYVMTLLEAFAYSAAVTVPFTRFFGVNGTCSVFAAGDILTLITLYIIVSIKNRSCLPKLDNFLLLDGKDFIPDEDFYKKAVSSMEDMETASREVEDFVRAHGSGKDPYLADKMSLCAEELCKNTITYGFTDSRKEYLEVSVLYKDGRYTMRIRDDCGQYDPVAYYSKYKEEHNKSLDEKYGLRIVFGLMEDVNYYGTLGLNSTVITA